MAPSITNYAEIQNDEIEVLRSIYMDDFMEEKPKTAAWNVGFLKFASSFHGLHDHAITTILLSTAAFPKLETTSGF